MDRETIEGLSDRYGIDIDVLVDMEQDGVLNCEACRIAANKMNEDVMKNAETLVPLAQQWGLKARLKVTRAIAFPCHYIEEFCDEMKAKGYKLDYALTIRHLALKRKHSAFLLGMERLGLTVL